MGRLLLESRSGAGGNRALILCSGVWAFVLGHWGDTHGRKNVLVLCMFMMGVSTFAVALLPGVCAALRALTGLLDGAGGDLGEVAVCGRSWRDWSSTPSGVRNAIHR